LMLDASVVSEEHFVESPLLHQILRVRVLPFQ
jgi:hypothetical protein